jgi:hypothetical protein
VVYYEPPPTQECQGAASVWRSVFENQASLFERVGWGSVGAREIMLLDVVVYINEGGGFVWLEGVIAVAMNLPMMGCAWMCR